MNDVTKSQLPEDQDVVYQLITLEEPHRTLYACRANGLYFSQDGGQIWKYAYQGLLGDTLLATLCVTGGTGPDGSQWMFAGVPGGVMRSKDQGEHWEAFPFAEPAPLVLGLAISPSFGTEGIILAATARDGVFCSRDFGQQWEAWNFGLLDANCNAICPSPTYAKDRTIFTCTNSGLFYTPNDGYSWRAVDFAPLYPEFLCITASVECGCLYAGTANGEIYFSKDQGQTWQVICRFPKNPPINGLYVDVKMPHNPVLVVLAGQRLYRSEDGGVTFNSWLNEHLPQSFTVTALSAPDGYGENTRIWLGSNDGVVAIQI